MFERTRYYNKEEAIALKDKIAKDGFISHYLELFYCLHDLAKVEERGAFKDLVDYILDYHIEKNPSFPQDHVKHEVLGRLEGVCIMVDSGRLSVGLPILRPEKPGKTLALFLELYDNSRKKIYPPLANLNF